MFTFRVTRLENLNTKDRVVDFISLMGNNMIPSTIAIREKHTYFLSDYCKDIEIDRIEERTLLNSTNRFGLFDFHVLKRGEIFSQK